MLNLAGEGDANLAGFSPEYRKGLKAGKRRHHPCQGDFVTAAFQRLGRSGVAHASECWFCPTGPRQLAPPYDLPLYANWTCHQLSHSPRETYICGQPSILHPNPIAERQWPMMSGRRVSRMEGLPNTSTTKSLAYARPALKSGIIQKVAQAS